MSLKPTIKTFSILATGGYYDEDSGRWTDDIGDEAQRVFEWVCDQYEGDESRLVVLRNTETGELWGVSTWYNGASWGDEPFLLDQESDVRPVKEVEVTRTEYEFVR